MTDAIPGGREAVEKLFRNPALSMERLPVLMDAFSALVTDCGDGLRSLCPHPATFVLDNADFSIAADILEGFQDGVAYIFYAKAWDTRIVIGVERNAVNLLVESVFGGDGSEAPANHDRSPSKLDIRFGQKLAELVAFSLQEQLEGVAAVDLVLERVEPVVSATTMGPSDIDVAYAEISIQIFNQTGRIYVMIPHSAIHPNRGKFERRGGSKSASVDVEWTEQLKSEVGNTTVTVKAVIDGGVSTLRHVANYKVGSVIELPLDAQNSVVAKCNNSKIFTGRLVQSQGS